MRRAGQTRRLRGAGLAVLLGTLPLTACTSTVSGTPDQSAGSDGPTHLSVPVELRPVVAQYTTPCSQVSDTSTTPATPTTTAPATTTTPIIQGDDTTPGTERMPDSHNKRCYDVTAPFLVLRQLDHVEPKQDPVAGTTVIDIKLSPDAAATFGYWTQSNIGKFVAVVIRGVVLAAPIVSQPITNGDVQLSGNFDADSAGAIVREITGS